jgi:hypothetical protein
LSTLRRNIADHEDPSRPSSPPKAEHHRQPLDPLRPDVLQTNRRHHENPDVELHPFCPFLSPENCRSTVAHWNRADLLRHLPYTVSTKIRPPPLTSATGEHISATSSFSSLVSPPRPCFSSPGMLPILAGQGAFCPPVMAFRKKMSPP